ncbi:MAG: alpha-L-arabinofuranosidase C-terminal domain-containing protein [Prevotellaceae bacterium]|nr:alpha-L-arabinofuranosidase C-terminal domain-containing protein [Prevotellaceae bacterium]
MNIKNRIAVAALAALSIASYADDKVFLYSPGVDKGVRIAYLDETKGTEGEFVDIAQIFSSDYARWGADKKMFSEFAVALEEGGYAAVFQVNDIAPCFAVAYSEDLVTWRPQDYPEMSHQGVIAPVIVRNGENSYSVVYKTKQGGYRKTNTDALFRHFSKDVEATKQEYEAADKKRDKVTIGGKAQTGNIISLEGKPQNSAAIIKYFDEQGRKAQMWGENLADDKTRFAQLLAKGQIIASLNVNEAKRKNISDKLIGIFFEDISYAADGGLYAELVQNRDFEYTPNDHEGWNAFTAWRLASGAEPRIVTDCPLGKHNANALIIVADTLYNSGWDGMTLKAGAKYDFSFYVNTKGKKRFKVAMVENGTVVAEAVIDVRPKDKKAETLHEGWQKYEVTLVPSADTKTAELRIVAEGKAEARLDMISLFPQDTFKGRKNGLRRDLAETIANLHPKFVRFPGGCMSHGDGLDNIYHWNHTVGPLYDRVPDRNIWRYHQTRGLGFFEYFQFCEDIGAEPLPVLAAGVPCQNSAPNANCFGGQQGGIPMEDMPAYIEELMNMIEWANGDPATNKWAKMRADAGHPEPFNLKYIGIGNEDIISTVFEDRCLMICKAIHEKYPEIEICGTAGPFHTPSSDYVEGWKFAKQHKDIFSLVDEHYYESVGWFINNQDYYDNYDRNAPKVYLGEYAARSKRGNIDCALAEALHLCAIERNGDVVSMTSYAPMLCHLKHQNWNPDMIYFDNETIDLTPSYETQRLFSKYAGDKFVDTKLSVDTEGMTEAGAADITKRVAATVVVDSKTGKRYLKVVNVLPVELQLEVDAAGLKQGAACEGFDGEPGQERVVIKTGKKGTLTEGKLRLQLPPYSLQVVEM